jgi:hypothetical protein
MLLTDVLHTCPYRLCDDAINQNHTFFLGIYESHYYELWNCVNGSESSFVVSMRKLRLVIDPGLLTLGF